ncbi:hypothetical protein [Bilophila wadsworthia]|uniref:hypothetical protein n=1 Tax=Bilophila wadsworthia TaxID=35833 RepID=UPI003990ADAA
MSKLPLRRKCGAAGKGQQAACAMQTRPFAVLSCGEGFWRRAVRAALEIRPPAGEPAAVSGKMPVSASG